MNKNKWFLNGGRGSGRAIRLLCETYENKIADLEKENARLKEINNHTLSQLNLDNGELIIENEKLKKENAELKKQLEMSNKVYNDNLDYSYHIEGQLTKAKELLERCYDNYIYLQPLRGDIEQFLKDSEEK